MSVTKQTVPLQNVVNLAHIVTEYQIKFVNGVSFVDLSPCVPPVPDVPLVVDPPPVGARLQQFWHIWQSLGASPRIVEMLRAGYTLPFHKRPILTRNLVR